MALTLTAGLVLHSNFKYHITSWRTQFLAPTPTNSSVDRIFQRIELTSFTALVQAFDSETTGKPANSEQVIILVNPKFFNDNFLSELAQSLAQMQQSTPGIKVVMVNEDELSGEERGQFLAILQGRNLADSTALDKLPDNLVKQNTLFFTKNAYDDKFEELAFSTFFNNKEYVSNYFLPLRTLKAQNESKLFEFAETRMSPDQVYFVAVLPTEGDQALTAEQNRIALKRLNDLKINSFLNDGMKYGVVHTKLTDLSFGKFNAGDIFMIQKNSKSKDIQTSEVSVLGDSKNVLVSKVIEGDLAFSTNWSLARSLKSISNSIF
jgi:hypothetical protein